MTPPGAEIGAVHARVQLPDDTDGETILANVRALRPAIVAARDEIEQGRRLPQQLAEALRQAGIYQLAMPRAWGGAEADPFVQYRILEELVLADASVAWCAAIGFAAGGYFTALLDQDVARALFPSVDLITAGANRQQGRAVKAPVGLAAIAAVKELAQGKSTMFGTGLRDEAYVQTAVARAEALVGSQLHARHSR